MNARVSPLALSGVVAAVTVALQLWLKLISRKPETGSSHALGRDDLVWWLDWVVAAAVSFTVLAFAKAEGASIEGAQILILVAILLLGFSGLPGVVRIWGYDEGPPPTLRTMRGILLPNLAGAVILTAAMAAGVELVA